MAGREQTGDQQIAELVAAAHQAGVALASHDDDSTAAIELSAQRQVAIAEFPTTPPLAATAKSHGATTLFGAPNVVRGGSHVGALDVTSAISDGVVDALCSDYHYPSLLSAPFVLVERGVLDLAAAWRLVSTAPAHAVGMDDRGELAIGKRGDVLVMHPQQPHPGGVAAVLVGGQPVLVHDPAIICADIVSIC